MSLRLSGPTQDISAWPINQQIIQDALHFDQLTGNRLTQDMIVSQLLRFHASNNLLCLLNQLVISTPTDPVDTVVLGGDAFQRRRPF